MQTKNYLALFILCGSLVYLSCTQDSVQFEWRQIESGTGEHLYGVHFVDAEHGWAVGTAGTILSTVNGGMTWTGGSVARETLTQVSFTTPNNGWLSSIGKVQYTGSGGASWRVQHQARGAGKRPPGILDLYFVSTTEGWAVGGSGTILHTKDGGQSFGKIIETFQINIFGVSILSIRNTDGLLVKRVKCSIREMVAGGGFAREVMSSNRYLLSTLRIRRMGGLSVQMD